MTPLSSPEPPEPGESTSNADESLVGEATEQAAEHQREQAAPTSGGEVEGLPVTEEGGEPEAATAPMPPADLTGEPTADEEVAPEQVEATAEAAEAEGHAEGTAAGAGGAGQSDPGQAGPESPPVAEAMASAAEGVQPEPAADPEPEPEPEPVDPTSPASADELRLGLLDVLKTELGEAVVGAHIRDGNDLWVRVTPEAWREAAQIAKGKLGCRLFVFLNAIDWMPSPYGRSENSGFDAPAATGEGGIVTGYAGGDTRFQVFGRVHNHEKGYGLILKVDVAEPEVGVPTWIPVYPGANWHERETWEMFGIAFSGHPHLVHLYLPTGFEGHPLRKDFPLLAREVKPWPGIVDVEPMPDEDEAEAAAEQPATEEPAQ